ncbi:MAG TPA: futalosine hydrolase [Bacteroidales bacterium]|nr:futalosine hydrolase [Bacteroidales bacterium]HPS18327.1 futalosine hydrolase [Bacteroidales bacterium]
MQILIVSATYNEVKPLIEKFILVEKKNDYFSSYTFNKINIDVLATGVGITSTAFHLGKILSLTKYDYVFNFGIAGAFNKSIKIGDVVNVASDIISELGAENGKSFLRFDELKIGESTMQKTAYKVENKNIINNPVISVLPVVKGITVNTVHGNSASISEIEKLFSPDVESMEGAAFLFACNFENLKCAQIRAISNHVEVRNIHNWNIELAIKNLNDTALKIINTIC